MTAATPPVRDADPVAMPSAVLDGNLSIYLDLLRRGAAVEVVPGHARHFIMRRLPGFLSGHTGKAIAIFFVLSGFVIAFVADRKERALRAYATARLSRLFPVCLIALASNVLFDLVSPPLATRSFACFAIVCVLVAANIVALRQLAPTRIVFPPRIGAAIRWLAGASFTLYLVHQPFLVMRSSLFPAIRTSAVAGGAAILATFVLALLLAELGDRRKRTFQSIAGRLLGVDCSTPGKAAA